MPESGMTSETEADRSSATTLHHCIAREPSAFGVSADRSRPKQKCIAASTSKTVGKRPDAAMQTEAPLRGSAWLLRPAHTVVVGPDAQLSEAELEFAAELLSWLCSQGLIGTLTMRRCMSVLLRYDATADAGQRAASTITDRGD